VEERGKAGESRGRGAYNAKDGTIYFVSRAVIAFRAKFKDEKRSAMAMPRRKQPRDISRCHRAATWRDDRSDAFYNWRFNRAG